MNNQTFYPPDQRQRSLFWGAVTTPQPGKRWIILTFDGTCIVSAVAYQYSRIWGLYVIGQVENLKLNVYRKIEEKLEADEAKRKQYVDFANCPPLCISFADWVQSAADTAQKAINQLSTNKKSQVIFLSTHPLWAKPDRIFRIFEKLGLEPANYPDLTLEENVEERGQQRIRQGREPGTPAVDADYYLLLIKKSKTGPQLIKRCIWRAGDPLDFTPNSRKNKSENLEVFPFFQDSPQYDIILTRENEKKPSLVSVTRVLSEKKPLQLSVCFEPMKETPMVSAAGAKNITLLENIGTIPAITIKPHQQPLQVAVLFDATMPEDQVEPVKEKLIAMAQSIAAAQPSARFGLVVYGDYSDKLGQADFRINKDIPHEFFPIPGWEKMCKDKVKRMKPVDFMAAMDQGLIRMEFFQWDPQAKKHLVVIFSSPPHPKEEPKRPIKKLPFFPAQHDWTLLLEMFQRKYQVDISVVYLPKKATEEEIKQEIAFTCSRMKAFDFKGEGSERIEEIGVCILKGIETTYRLEPGTFHIPITMEEDQ